MCVLPWSLLQSQFPLWAPMVRLVVSLALSLPYHSSRMGHWGYICSLHRVLPGSETPGTKYPAFMPLNHLAPQTQWLYPNYLTSCSGGCHGQPTEMYMPKESKKCTLWWGALPGSKTRNEELKFAANSLLWYLAKLSVCFPVSQAGTKHKPTFLKLLWGFLLKIWSIKWKAVIKMFLYRVEVGI